MSNQSLFAATYCLQSMCPPITACAKPPAQQPTPSSHLRWPCQHHAVQQLLRVWLPAQVQRLSEHAHTLQRLGDIAARLLLGARYKALTQLRGATGDTQNTVAAPVRGSHSESALVHMTPCGPITNTLGLMQHTNAMPCSLNLLLCHHPTACLCKAVSHECMYDGRPQRCR